MKKKEGGQDWIEGPSIKLANDVARIFGNNVNEIREVDVGDAWVFYARFTDIETGFSYERAYRQRKSQGSMRTRDADRQLDIAYQIGQIEGDPELHLQCAANLCRLRFRAGAEFTWSRRSARTCTAGASARWRGSPECRSKSVAGRARYRSRQQRLVGARHRKDRRHDAISP